MLPQFQAIGQALAAKGLVSCFSGNLSVKLGERMVITHWGSMLGAIGVADLVETGIGKNDRFTPLASTELEVHRYVYKRTPALAIVHAHPLYAVTLSLTMEEVIPRDMEGKKALGKVPILGNNLTTVEAGSLVEEITEALKQHRVVLVRGHGSFATGQLLEEAYYYTAVLEKSCHILYLLKMMEKAAAAGE